MPVDPTLYPSIPDPQQALWQRLAALESRVAAMDAKRDPILTPVAIGPSGTATFTWYGGRLWGAFGGIVNSTGTGQIVTSIDLNGAGVVANLYAEARTSGLAYPMHWTTSLIATSWLNLATTNTFTSSISLGPGQLPSVSVLLIEWPQA